MAKLNVKVDLIFLGNGNLPVWPLGSILTVAPSPSAISDLITEQLKSSEAEAWLFWDTALPLPEANLIMTLLEKPVDVWHAGLLMGMNGLPKIIDFVAGTWMLNRDPFPDLEATSWRLTLRACLIRCEVLIKMGGIYSEFKTIEGASLELGHRYITQGVIIRHIPSLISNSFLSSPGALPIEDEIRFMYHRFSRKWIQWAIFRGITTRYLPILSVLRNARRFLRSQRYEDQRPIIYKRVFMENPILEKKPRVSVLIPTVGRYPYLRTLLGQIRTQTMKPFEIIIVDQTPLDRRDTSLANDFKDLPIKIIYMDKIGQCSSRNTGLHAVTGDYVFFADDDIEITESLLEQHLSNIWRYQTEVSSGVANEIGAGPLPENFRLTRMSDVFPLGNSMIRTTVLSISGLLDLAYDHGPRADGDMGMRLYLNGVIMMLNSEIAVLHHRAPRGGLRTHKARVMTYAGSRKSLFQRHLPSVTEIYLAKRYFTPRQVREMILLRVLGTFSLRGNSFMKIIKCLISAVCLPHTLWQLYRKYREAEQMLKEFPQIPKLYENSLPNNG